MSGLLTGTPINTSAATATTWCLTIATLSHLHSKTTFTNQ